MNLEIIRNRYKNKKFNDVLNRLTDTEQNIVLALLSQHENADSRLGEVIDFGSYYFDEEIRPLKWTIVKEDETTYTLASINIIEYIDFSKDNNYKDSNARKWLNTTFYNFAFNNEEKSLIVLTEIDNSVESTGQSENKWVCKNTTDNVWIPSFQEYNSLCESDFLTHLKPTKYAKNKANKSSDFILRSPYSINDLANGRYWQSCYMLAVSDDEVIAVNVEYEKYGIVPFIRIKK